MARKIFTGIILVVVTVLGLCILSGILLALAGGMSGHNDWKVVGGALVIFGIAPFFLLMFSEIGQALHEFMPIGRTSKAGKNKEEAGS